MQNKHAQRGPARRRLRTLLTGLLLAPLLVGASEPPPLADCAPEDAEVPLASTTGSAGFMHNIAGHPDSIREIAGRLLEEALRDPNGKEAPCEPDCSDDARAEVVYRVAPTAFLATEEQREVCLRFEDETREHPFEFAPRAFETLDELNEWIMEFSQGRGEDGKLLYERCSSNCSPRYTFLIAEQTAGYEVRAEVLCGLARDKTENRYRISTALRRSCAVN